MSLEDNVKLINQMRPMFAHYLNEYAKTGLYTYEKLLEFELKEIHENFGDTYYKEFYALYEQVKSKQENGRP